MKKIKYALKLAAVCVFAALILMFPSETAESTVRSIDICISSVIPSMFAFMVLSSYVIGSGLFRILSKPLIKLFGWLIRTDECTLSVFFLSLFGGYPVGVKLLGEIIAQNKNYHAIADKAAIFCYCVSPSFAVIMLGGGIFGSTDAGAVIYLSNVAALIITAAAVTRIYDLKIVPAEIKINGGLNEAVSSSARSLFTVCSVIVVFNIALTCITCLSERLGIAISPGLLGFFEITNLLAAERPTASLIPLVSAAASFGGVCVLAQSSAMIKGSFDPLRFFAARIPCAILSGLIARLMLCFFDISVTASAGTNAPYTFVFSANKAVVVILTVMCVIIFNKTEKIFKKV